MKLTETHHPAWRLLPELRELLFLARRAQGLARVETLARLECDGHHFPLLAFRFGPSDPTAPVLALFGGVHGLERIGTRVVTSYLQTVLSLARWDRSTQRLLEETRLLVVPLVNPVGMYWQRRSNGNFVDIMRNAPVEAEGVAGWQIFGGHRLSPRLPWYRGQEGAPLETETQAVCDLVRREVFPAKVALSIDVHSGYGKVDRLWFPYAKTKTPFASVPQAMALKHLLDKAYGNHIYRVEPQCREYLAHGDLWDYLYDDYRQRQPQGDYIPFTLEMGSWLWVKKNWRQLFSLPGIFNPRLPHRERRILRRHTPLLDLLLRAVQSPEPWTQLNHAKRQRLLRHGHDLWYGG